MRKARPETLPADADVFSHLAKDVTTHLLIGVDQGKRNGVAIFESNEERNAGHSKALEESDLPVTPEDRREVVEAVVRADKKATLVAYWGEVAFRDGVFDPVEVINENMENGKRLAKPIYKALMILKDEVKEKSWKKVPKDILCCFVYAYDILPLPSNTLPEGYC